MPTVLRWNGYRFYFFSNEGHEPAHIHIDKDGNTVKFWLENISVARNTGFTARELGVIEAKVREERTRFIEAWHEYFGNHS
ncbi:MAG: DUF4160 domain-containing protein [Rhizomicrobium sp.]